MEEVYALQCMQRFLELKNECIEAGNKLIEAREAYINAYTAILEEQISYPTIEANLEQVRKDLHSLTSSSNASQINNEKEHMLRLEHLKNLERGYSHLLVKIDSPKDNLLEIKCEKCTSLVILLENKIDELNELSSGLHGIISSINHISVKNTNEVDIIFLYCEIMKWHGQISLANELDASQKYVLTSYISSKMNNNSASTSRQCTKLHQNSQDFTRI